MKKNKIAWWATTGLLSLMMAFSAFSYITSAEMIKAFQFLGFPGYFRIELAVAKIIGVIVLLVPAVSARVKEWAYAGFGIVFISAIVAHISSGDVAGTTAPLVAMILLTTSYITYHRLKTYDKLSLAV
jgi:DoxX-like family